MLADYHVHTDLSNDSDYPMEDTVKRAITLGFDELCFTEHLDYFVNDDKYVVDFEAYQKEYKRMVAKYGDQITLKYGMEYGIQTHMLDTFAQNFSEYAYDFIILSNHQIGDQEIWTGEYQQGKTQAAYNQDYYQAILEMIQAFKHYSVLGHLDVIKRYDAAGVMDDRENETLIRAILERAIKDGKGIEINTSNFRYGLSDLTPSRLILKWYKEMGGEILTIGSDSHEEEHVGAHIIEVRKELKKMGFESFCTFDKMEPTYHPL